MKFKKTTMKSLAWDEPCCNEEDDIDAEIIKNEMSGDRGRWTVGYELIFKFDGKFYQSFYQLGATENQDMEPYEYEGDWIECEEVFPVEKTITDYLSADEITSAKPNTSSY